MQSSVRGRLTRYGLLTGVVVAVFLAVEIGLRFGCGLGNPILVYQDQSYGYAYAPDQDVVRFGHRIKYNHQGMRSEELDSRPKVLCVGDSVTNGGAPTSQSDTFPYLTESDLKAIGKNVQFLNASAGGWAPANEAAFLSRWGTYGARVVVVEIGTNDFFQKKADEDVVGVDPDFPNKKPMLATEELATRYLWPRIRASLSRPVGAAQPAMTTESLGQNLTIIAGMMDYAKTHGASVVLLLTPDREEIEQPPDYLRLRATAESAGREAIARLCAQHGVTLIDIRPEFAKHRSPTPFRDSVHPNESGNKIIAQVLANALSGYF